MSDTKELQARALGHNGPIDLAIDFEGHQLTDVKVTHHSETKGIFNQVFGKLRDTILEEQSFGVDVVSGASVMSKAILDSANEAIEKAGIKLAAPVKKERENVEEHTDVAVIGGGEAGLVAACKALSRGKKVALFEKNGYLGGATILNGSNVTATGSKVASTIFGVAAAKDTPELLSADVARECLDSNIPVLTKLMAENIGNAIDFISDFAGLEYRKAQTQTPEHSVERQVELPSSSSYELIEKVAAAFVKKGGKIFLDSRVEEILTDENGKITGFVAEGRTKKITVYANSFVLATGGYGANKQMRGQESEGLNYYGPLTSTGDAYEFLKAFSLEVKNIGWYKVYPHGVETEPGIAKLTTYASKKATDLGAVYVNQLGKRIVDESDVYATLRNAVLKQPGRVAYLVMDKRTWKEFYNLLVLHDFTAEEIAEYFAKDGKENPIFVKGTLSEVAKKAGINADNLKATITTYNEYATKGKDQEFKRDRAFLHAYEGEEFYVVEQRDRFATTLGGFVTDADLHLKTQDNKKIANLWGAGEVIGGANGHDSMPSMMNTWGISSGFVAGNSVE
ncbi:FAD-dependent oxidoreductase [Ligilactobacillus sp. WILCCON 0076]|uniref:Urocanate reductase n=1 Tax=Ligilactobacillus ubinensis TaxID=2876789 RepID=A0A9X2JM31_9LACO|nr:FAD-dependent oxidoreductase [Ligilactobacillus ubinensis]MCP0887250.1 FAD-dependent oxidoreductase [Ligilactobacillus ubinensis]